VVAGSNGKRSVFQLRPFISSPEKLSIDHGRRGQGRSIKRHLRCQHKVYVLGTTGGSVKLINFDGTSGARHPSDFLDAPRAWVAVLINNNVLYAINR